MTFSVIESLKFLMMIFQARVLWELLLCLILWSWWEKFLLSDVIWPLITKSSNLISWHVCLLLNSKVAVSRGFGNNFSRFLIRYIELALSTWSSNYNFTTSFFLGCDFFNRFQRWRHRCIFARNKYTTIFSLETILLIWVVATNHLKARIVIRGPTHCYINLRFFNYFILSFCNLQYGILRRSSMLLSWNHNASRWITFDAFIKETVCLIEMSATALLSRNLFVARVMLFLNLTLLVESYRSI